MKTLKDLNIDNKKVIIRCDLNVPIEDNKIIDNTDFSVLYDYKKRLQRSLFTFLYLNNFPKPLLQP